MKKLCKDCKHCDRGYVSFCERTKYRDKVNGERGESASTERCLPWLGAILFNMCGKTGRFFERKEA